MKKSIIVIIAIAVVCIAIAVIFMATRPKVKTVTINFEQYGIEVTEKWNAKIEGNDNPEVKFINSADGKCIIAITYKNAGNYELTLTDENNISHNYTININEKGIANVTVK